jgi:hypothetical protein
MLGAGRPVVVSRTWQVIGSLDAILEKSSKVKSIVFEGGD